MTSGYALVFMVIAATIAFPIAIYLLYKVFGLIFQMLGNLFGFIGSEIRDALKLVGTVIVIPIFSLLVLLNVIIGRWSASAHFGRNVSAECKSFGACVYRLAVGNPVRLLGLGGALQGVEERLPQAMAEAPGRDKPRGGKTGRFEGYNIIGSLPGGGSGAKLYIAEPDVMKRAALERRGMGDVDRVVIKSFSLKDGSTLPQIMREGQSLGPAKELGLVLEHSKDDQDRFYYVMRYVPGDSLGIVTQRLHAQSPDEGLDLKHLRLAMGYAADLVDSLHTYHMGGLWHKDVKPDNIIIDQTDNRAHLVDFGLVTQMRSAMTLTTHGTEYFRDPELVRQALRGVKVNEIDGAKFDVYSAGAVIFSVIENSFPAHGGLSQLSKRCPDALRWVVRRAMADYQRRYATAAEMRADLEVVLQAADPFALKPVDLPSMSGAENSVTADAEASEVSPFAAVWNKIGQLAGEPFQTKTGLGFTYDFDGSGLTPSRTGYRLSKTDFETAHKLMPLDGPGQINNIVRGPAYIWAILSDQRVAVSHQGATPTRDPFVAAAGAGAGAVASVGSAGAQAFASSGSPAPSSRGTGAPRLRVSDWWTGRYTPERGPAGHARTPFTDTPFEKQHEKIKEALRKSKSKIRRSMDQAGESARSGRRGTPVPPAPRQVVPMNDRAPAADQLKNARERVRRTRAQAHQRMSGRRANARISRTRPARDGTKGLIIGLALAMGMFFLIVAIAGAIFITPSSRSAGGINAAEISISPEGVSVSIGRSDDSAGFENIVYDLPALDQRVLVLSELTSPIDAQIRASLTQVFGSLAQAGAELRGDLVTLPDESDTQAIDLIARVRADRGALPLDSSDLGGRLKNTLASFDGEFDALLWVAPGSAKPERVEFILVSPKGVRTITYHGESTVTELVNEFISIGE